MSVAVAASMWSRIFAKAFYRSPLLVLLIKIDRPVGNILNRPEAKSLPLFREFYNAFRRVVPVLPPYKIDAPEAIDKTYDATERAGAVLVRPGLLLSFASFVYAAAFSLMPVAGVAFGAFLVLGFCSYRLACVRAW